MPLVKRDLVMPSGGSGHETASLIAALNSADADARWKAARGLGGRAEAVPALAAALAVEPLPRVCEAIITAFVRTGDGASAAALLPYLHSPDAGRRNAAIEALQAMPQAVAPFMASLLRDGNSDVRLLAIELVRGMPAVDATRLLCGVLEQEQHPNVCAAAVDVLAEVGTREALPALAACARRFTESPFLPFAISVAVARIADA